MVAVERYGWPAITRRVADALANTGQRDREAVQT